MFALLLAALAFCISSCAVRPISDEDEVPAEAYLEKTLETEMKGAFSVHLLAEHSSDVFVVFERTDVDANDKIRERSYHIVRIKSGVEESETVLIDRPDDDLCTKIRLVDSEDFSGRMRTVHGEKVSKAELFKKVYLSDRSIWFFM